jgi:undecaprenyl-diphosphatase
MSSRVAIAFERFDRAELQFCRTLNRSTARPMIRTLFRSVSWLGDGWFWYGLMVLLATLAGTNGALVAAQMVLAGGVGVAIYRKIKTRAVRERPFITHSAIHCAAAPLDRYSFPSGHTLHAVSYTMLVSSYFPVLTGPLTAFAVLVALSRVVLGLHYPTDVAAGALLGAGLATISLQAASLLGI